MQKICPLHYLDVISFMPSHCIDYDHNAALHALYCRFLVDTDRAFHLTETPGKYLYLNAITLVRPNLKS